MEYNVPKELWSRTNIDNYGERQYIIRLNSNQDIEKFRKFGIEREGGIVFNKDVLSDVEDVLYGATEDPHEEVCCSLLLVIFLTFGATVPFFCSHL